jgi:hypothetical protein
MDGSVLIAGGVNNGTSAVMRGAYLRRIVRAGCTTPLSARRASA